MDTNLLSQQLLSQRVLQEESGHILKHEEIIQVLLELKSLVTTCYLSGASQQDRSINANTLLLHIRSDLAHLLAALRGHVSAQDEDYQQADEFLEKLPNILDMLDLDLQALLDGDPAAESKSVIVLSYPGFFAIMTYRVAHELRLMGIPMIPRVMSEYAHSVTGIDINPGATIGKSFFIDHGTGVVVGETCVIGDRVKIYQGVTLGALSTRKGQLLSGVRRHPTIQDDVTIYAGAVILGGDTVVGRGSTIGGGTFITESIPAYSRVSNPVPELHISEDARAKAAAHSKETSETSEDLFERL